MNSKFCSIIAFLHLFFLPISADEDLSKINLDIYLNQNNFFLSPSHSNVNEGYSSKTQRERYKQDLKNSPHIKSIAEIGFNAGHSCEAFLESSKTVEVVSFDINMHPYTKVGVEFMQKKYPGHFTFISGNSNITIKNYAESSGRKFDLIFIDGCHEFNCAVSDIINCQKLAHKETIVWIDDYADWGVKNVVDHCVKLGLIKVIETHSVVDSSGVRAWAKVKYEYLSDTEKFFNNVYSQGLWGKNEKGQGISGPGSTLPQGLPFIQYITNFLGSHEVQSIVDLGCGDWVLAREIPWGSRNYFGIDVVKSVIEKNQLLYESETIHFLQLDVALEPLPTGDLFICKDVLMHLPNADIFRILNESKKFKYCIFVNDYTPNKQNTDIPTYGFRCLDLTKPPFNLHPAQIDYYTSSYATKQIVVIRN